MRWNRVCQGVCIHGQRVLVGHNSLVGVVGWMTVPGVPNLSCGLYFARPGLKCGRSKMGLRMWYFFVVVLETWV